MDAPFLDSSTRSKWNCWSKAIWTFFGVMVATACMLGIANGTIPSPGISQNSAVDLFMEEKWCQLQNFRDVALKTVLDATVFGLVVDINKEQKFEASGVVKEGHAFYVICDSSWSIPVFHDLSSSGSFDAIYDAEAKTGDRWQSSDKN